MGVARRRFPASVLTIAGGRAALHSSDTATDCVSKVSREQSPDFQSFTALSIGALAHRRPPMPYNP